MKARIIITALCAIFILNIANALNLDEALDLALKNNTSLKMAQNTELARKYNKYQANISRLGEVSAIGNITHYNLERTLTPMVPPITPPFPLADDTITNVGGSYTVPIFTGFRLSKNISIASLSHEIAKLQFFFTKRSVKFNVYSIFLKGLSLKGQLQAKIEQEKALSELYKNVDLGVKVGRYAAIDLKKVAYQYEIVKAQKQNLKSNITSLKWALNQLTGLEKNDWDFENVELKEKEYPSLDEILKSAFINREDVAIIVKKKQISRANYAKSKYAYLPDIYGNYTYVRSIVNDGSVPIWNYGLFIKWSVFDFGKKAFDMASLKQEYKSAKEAELSQNLSVRREVVDAYENMKTQITMHEAAAKALQYAKDALDVENVKYQQGVGSMYDLLFSIAQYYEAVSQERGAYYGIFIAEKYLEFTAGGKI